MAALIEESCSNAAPATGQDGARPVSVVDAYRYCERLARSHYENFNVGGWITPKHKLPHVYAIYAWCRMVDDLGDEIAPQGHPSDTVPTGQPDPTVTAHRLGRLDWWESELDGIYHGQPYHPIALAVRDTVGKFNIPREPFSRLIQANRIDQGSGRFGTLDEVFEYCTYSANPVGHLYLYLFGYDDLERQGLADYTCTALQLTNFWQDVARDYRDRGRIYLPQADMAAFGVSEEDIASGCSSDEFRALLGYECDVAMRLFQKGAPLVKSLEPSARLAVALFTRGGVAVLDAIRQRDYDVLSERPALSSRRKAWLLASAWMSNKFGMGYGLPQG